MIPAARLPGQVGSATLWPMLFRRTEYLDLPGPLLVLVHGLGGHADLWRPVLDRLAPVPSLAVDLSGHGRSARGFDYLIETHADQLAAIVPEDRELVFLAHSMGGMVSLRVAARRPLTRAVVAVGVKYQWSPTHLAGLKVQAARSTRDYATRAEALDRHRRLTGLQETLGADDPLLGAGVVAHGSRWRVAQDQRTYDVGVPQLQQWVDEAGCEVRLAVGASDPLIPADSLTGLRPPPLLLPGLGHNPHVEDPDVVAGLVRPYLGVQHVPG